MTLHAGELASHRPSPVAVHDDGDMAGQPVRVDALQDLAFGGAGLCDLIER